MDDLKPRKELPDSLKSGKRALDKNHSTDEIERISLYIGYMLIFSSGEEPWNGCYQRLNNDLTWTPKNEPRAVKREPYVPSAEVPLIKCILADSLSS